MSGTLYVVATPIGNLEDLSFRALRILREVDAIACEDTRQTAKILQAHGLRKDMISYYEPKERQRLPLILGLLESGKSVALVSDAGTPGLSDPGFRLVRAAVEKGIKVVTVPGPTALAAALAGSGLPTYRFLFLGFPPPKETGTRKLLESVREEEGTLVFYLPARRVQGFLRLVLDALSET